MSSYKKFLIALGVLVAVAVVLYGLSFLIARPSSAPPQTEPHNNTVTITGTLTCLPHKASDGPQTLECTIGLRDDNGEHYGLKEIPGSPPNVDTEVEVTGPLSQPTDDDIYDVTGYITVEHIKQTNQ